MTPSWYDVLDVDPDAGTDEIRAAWRASVADLDPTDRRFRAYNKAAEVLLDSDRRRAHDLELAAGLEDEEADAEADAEADVDRPGSVIVETAPNRALTPEVSVPVKPRTPSGQSPASGRRAPGVLLASVLGVVALVLLVVALVVTTQRDGGGGPVSSGDLPDAREVAAAREAAEAAVVPVLSYDYRDLEKGKQAALSYMTPEYAAEYEQLFESVIAVNAPSTETVVEVEVLASGIVRTGPDLVDVLLFVNRPTVNREQTTPEIYRDQATLRMREVAGTWLVDCVISGAGSTCGE